VLFLTLVEAGKVVGHVLQRNILLLTVVNELPVGWVRVVVCEVRKLFRRSYSDDERNT
jgi:hypothetical protein